MGAVYRKELKSSLCNMTGVIFIAYVLIWFGIYTVAINLMSAVSQFEYTVSSAGFISLLAIPVLTMRSFAEEKNNKTDQLLYSLPVNTASVVISKFLAMVTVFAVPVAIVSFYPFILGLYGSVYINTAYSTLVAYFFLGCSLIAIGMFISSLTDSQVIAAVLNTGAIILIYFMSSIAGLFSSAGSVSFACILVLCVAFAFVAYALTKNYAVGLSVGALLAGAAVACYAVKPALFENLVPEALESLDIFSRTNAFVNGIFDLPAIVFYLSVTVFFCFLTVQSMEKKRWN